MAGLKSTAWWSRKQLVPALITFTVLYQLVYNIILFNVVQQEAGQEECSAMPGVANADSPHCLEVRLFRSWHEEAMNDGAEDAGLLISRTGAGDALVDVIGPGPHSSITVLVANHTTHIGEQLEASDSEDKRAIERIRHHDARVQQRHVLMEKLEKQISASLNTSSDITPWAKDLMTLQRHFETEMHSHDVAKERTERFRRLERAVQDSLSSSSDTPWAKGLMKMRDHLESELNASQSTLHAAAQARHARHMAMRANLTTEISERMTKLEDHLHRAVSERDTWEVKLLNKYGIIAGPTTAAPSFLEKRLQWSAVSKWSKRSWRPKPSWLQSKPSIFSRHELRHMHWFGAIPKVACITSIRSSRHTKARMMYFVNNFRLQDYEGTSQLVFVYHHSDTDAAELIRAYVDGTSIRGVAVHGENVYPSSAALRYGAWSSDADVIARWDFDEWHDPDRLSMQIRALARAQRPACILRPAQPDGNAAAQNASSASSLVGERSWMEMHWVPHAKEEITKLKTAVAAEMVELDMQKDILPSHFSHINQTLDKSPGKEGPNSHTAEANSWNMSQCLEFDNSNHSLANGRHVEKSIAENYGPEMSKEFHTLMVRHHDITQKLQLLCLQSVLEHNPRKQLYMWKHVDTMAGVRAELDKHMASMTTLLAGS